MLRLLLTIISHVSILRRWYIHRLRWCDDNGVLVLNMPLPHNAYLGIASQEPEWVIIIEDVRIPKTNGTR